MHMYATCPLSAMCGASYDGRRQGLTQAALTPMPMPTLTLTLPCPRLQDFEGQRAVDQISRNGLLALTVRLSPLPSLPPPPPLLFLSSSSAVRLVADGRLLGAVRCGAVRAECRPCRTS